MMSAAAEMSRRRRADFDTISRVVGGGGGGGHLVDEIAQIELPADVVERAGALEGLGSR